MSASRVLLLICDGWGEAPPSEANAISLARTPTFDRWRARHPWTTLEASGEAVGLPAGLMGNSEVGHLNLGAGRMVPQDLLRVDLALRDGSFFDNRVLIGAVERARSTPGATLHLMGLLSDGGVHSHERHLFGLLDLARRHGVPRVRVHAFTDGRDTPPRSALAYVDALERELAGKTGEVASVSGRYYAMDRDGRWDRVALAWEALRHGRGRSAPSARTAVEDAYARGESDEFIVPTVIEKDGAPSGPIADGDSVIFFNFRADRARQLTRAFTEPGFTEFPRGDPPEVHFVCFTEYKKEFALPVAFPTPRLDRILAAVWADAGVRNLRVAETEKYAHVTYFFNGGVEEPFPGEDRRLVPSWRGATYDLHPQMSAVEITNEATRAMSLARYGAMVVNFANADMVGHTGRLRETVAAVETLDRCFAQLESSARDHGWLLVMTADHGNAEQMVDPETGQPHTAHTTNPVPIVIGRPGRPLRRGGALKDVAPTVLALQGLTAPPEMTGRDLRELQNRGPASGQPS
ncbi:MAG TPA: 2,3-bisphosphoglycerate-independent phosphoglycerate mutase [Thermoanaerobaculia bacterium]|nr:2,3-bisphosphoglycerate-independent phosphoglycerate mutase [Thermoanaerobaculia bacterium]